MTFSLRVRLGLGRGLVSWFLVMIWIHRAVAAAPAWLQEDARSTLSPAASEMGATIVRSENIITISNDGTWQQLYRYAVRIERAQGANFALIGVPYIEKTDEIINADAWLLRQGQTVKSYPRKLWLDRADVDDATLYSDFRALSFGCPIAVPDDTFGGEVQLRQNGYLGQRELNFSFPLPARIQRLEVRAPKGWQVNLSWLNGKGSVPLFSAERNAWTWEIRDQPAERSEIWAPDESLMRAVLTVTPPAGKPGAGSPVPKSWQDVAVHLANIQNAQCDTDASLSDTAKRLTTGLSDPWKKIQALTAFVQNRRYIAVNRNNGLGFGYRPRKATAVLAADYGDCKDKSNLLRALLREAGFRAYLVAAYIGDSATVISDWPSPMQFNHAIVAIELPPEMKSPAAVNDPVFGRLLFFDSTARSIPVGHLPWALQGSQGLICDSRTLGLVKFPSDAVEDEFKAITRVTIDIDALGGCRGEATETMHGQLAAWMRDVEIERSPPQQMSYWTQRVTSSIAGSTLEKFVVDAAADGWGYTTKVRFTAAKFGQPFRSGMRLFNIDVFWPEAAPRLPDKPRQHDLMARPIHLEHEVSLNLPIGSRPEVPGPKTVQTGYGQFKVTYETAGGRIICRRQLILNAMRVMPDKYPEYRHFLADVAKAERVALLVRMAGGVQKDSTGSEAASKSSVQE